MKIIGKAFLIFCCSALLSCSDASKNKTDSASKSSAETLYSSETVDDELTSSIASSKEKTCAASWTLTSDALEETKESKYLEDFEFSILDEGGNPVSFHGDYVQQGNGEYEGMMQLKKSGAGMLECRTLLNGIVTLDVYKKTSTFSGEDHDFTGVPDFYVSSDLISWSALTGSKEDSSTNCLYTFKVTDAYFMFTTKTGNALYLNSVSFSPYLL